MSVSSVGGGGVQVAVRGNSQANKQQDGPLPKQSCKLLGAEMLLPAMGEPWLCGQLQGLEFRV